MEEDVLRIFFPILALIQVTNKLERAFFCRATARFSISQSGLSGKIRMEKVSIKLGQIGHSLQKIKDIYQKYLR